MATVHLGAVYWDKRAGRYTYRARTSYGTQFHRFHREDEAERDRDRYAEKLRGNGHNVTTSEAPCPA